MPFEVPPFHLFLCMLCVKCVNFCDSMVSKFHPWATPAKVVEFDIERDHHRKGAKNRLVARPGFPGCSAVEVFGTFFLSPNSPETVYYCGKGTNSTVHIFGYPTF